MNLLDGKNLYRSKPVWYNSEDEGQWGKLSKQGGFDLLEYLENTVEINIIDVMIEWPIHTRWSENFDPQNPIN